MAFGPNKTEGKNGCFKFEGKGVFILHLDTNKEGRLGHNLLLNAILQLWVKGAPSQ